MHIRNLVSPLALAAALSFSGGALAQDQLPMMDGIQISANQLPEVEARCRTLAAEARESLVDLNDDEDDSGLPDTGDTDGDTDTGDTDDGGAVVGGSDQMESDDDEASGLAQALTPGVDLDTITFEDCRDAGFIDREAGFVVDQ